MDNNIHESELVELCDLLQLLSRQYNGLLKHCAQCYNINSVECSILYELRNNSDLSLNDLARLVGLDSSTTSRYVQKLVENGLVNRQTDAHDRRFTILSLTDAGRDLNTAIIQSMIEQLPETFNQFSKEKLIAICEELLVIIRRLKEQAD